MILLPVLHMLYIHTCMDPDINMLTNNYMQPDEVVRKKCFGHEP